MESNEKATTEALKAVSPTETSWQVFSPDNFNRNHVHEDDVLCAQLPYTSLRVVFARHKHGGTVMARHVKGRRSADSALMFSLNSISRSVLSRSGGQCNEKKASVKHVLACVGT
jgi:hypothetical protein